MRRHVDAELQIQVQPVHEDGEELVRVLLLTAAECALVFADLVLYTYIQHYLDNIVHSDPKYIEAWDPNSRCPKLHRRVLDNADGNVIVMHCKAADTNSAARAVQRDRIKSGNHQKNFIDSAIDSHCGRIQGSGNRFFGTRRASLITVFWWSLLILAFRS